MTDFDRDDLIEGLRQVIHKLHMAGVSGSINIVGGASISLSYFERRSTVDIDALLTPSREILAASEEVARENGWDVGWLNNKAQGFIPLAQGDWDIIYDERGVVVSVAQASTLLAMKIQASRPTRDGDDLRGLLAICGITTIAEAEAHYEEFYRGEVVPDKAYALLEGIFKQGIPPAPQAPPKPEFRV